MVRRLFDCLLVCVIRCGPWIRKGLSLKAGKTKGLRAHGEPMALEWCQSWASCELLGLCSVRSHQSACGALVHGASSCAPALCRIVTVLCEETARCLKNDGETLLGGPRAVGWIH